MEINKLDGKVCISDLYIVEDPCEHLINEIAEQTSLLALNAAIETARAGGQGRGLADEVRSPAPRTKDSADSIQSMIAELQQQAQNAVAVMENGKQYTVNTVDQVSKAETALSLITTDISVINNMSA